MFYEPNMDNALRFGDAIEGLVSVVPIFKDLSSNFEYNLDISLPSYSVIMTPCCSIEDKEVAIAPLVPIKDAYIQNPYFTEDFTRLNNKIEPRSFLSDTVWAKLPPEEQARRISVGPAYFSSELFFYEGHPLLPSYTLKYRGGLTHTTTCYMVNFKSIYKIKCDKIIRSTQNQFETKRLQLSIQTRDLLRDRLNFFFGRVPDEDIVNL